MIYKNLKKPIVTFFSGIAFSFLLFSIYAFTAKSPSPVQQSQVQPITLQDAVQLTKSYTSVAKPLNSVFRAYAINKDQLSAMNQIYDANPNFSGFRIYEGLDNNSNKVEIVVGITSGGDDATGKTMYLTPGSDTGPCPNVCDMESPL